MDSKKFGQRYTLRFDKGDDFFPAMKDFCRKKKIGLASFSAIGAFDYAKLGFFDISSKKYVEKEFNENVEVLSLCGNITMKEKDVVVHCHAMLGRKDYSVIGGHLISGRVSVTLEIFLVPLKGKVSRARNEEFSLYLMKL